MNDVVKVVERVNEILGGNKEVVIFSDDRPGNDNSLLNELFKARTRLELARHNIMLDFKSKGVVRVVRMGSKSSNGRVANLKKRMAGLAEKMGAVVGEIEEVRRELESMAA